MQRFLELRLLPLLFCALTALLPAEKVELILTGETSGLYPEMTDAPPGGKSAADRYEAELQKLKSAHPDALLFETGNFVSLVNALETNYRQAKVFDTMKFAAVNMSARDVALGAVGGLGFHRMEDRYRKPLIASADSKPKALGLKPAARAKAGAAEVCFVSAEGFATASALTGKMPFLEPTEPDDVARAIVEAKAAKCVVVAVVSGKAGDRGGMGLNEADLLIDRDYAGKDPEKSGKGWRIRPPHAGEILRAELERGADGALAKPKVQSVRYLSDAELGQLVKYPASRIGLPVPNFDSVMTDFFNPATDSFREDKVSREGLEALTEWREPRIYHVKTESKDLRVYRVQVQMPDYRFMDKGIMAGGWPAMDILVAIGADGTVDRVLNRNGLPAGASESTIPQSLNKLSGKAPDAWSPDPELTSGALEVWKWGVHEMKRVLELDKKLYGKGGKLYTEPKG